ncbi:MAG: hypothetical protein HRT74_10065, partial [Flavobacteriales bacterium]|nr:hypothetical protein [Flavobacteriales bacterium]
YNDKGQLIERSLPEAIPQGWQKETMEYDGHGTLVSCKQWIQKDGEWVVYTQQSFLDEVMEMEFRAKNTLTNVFNLEGLPLVQYSREGNGEVLATTR